MTTRGAIQILLFSSCTVATVHLLHAERGGSYAYQIPTGGTAVDTKGKRHTAREYPSQRAPWNFADRIAAVAPDYPRADRASRHQGTGFFCILIDLKSGVPTQVTALRSTGYATLDACAIAALRRWRWKRGTWKEVDVPVTFEMAPRAGTTPPPGTLHLPP
jgi:TonB family protein